MDYVGLILSPAQMQSPPLADRILMLMGDWFFDPDRHNWGLNIRICPRSEKELKGLDFENLRDSLYAAYSFNPEAPIRFTRRSDNSHIMTNIDRRILCP